MSTSAAATIPEVSTLGVESHILGQITASQEQCFTFPQGILGFPACKRFVLLPAEHPGFFWLQSMECESLAFLLVDPFACIDQFSVDLSDGDLLPLRAARAAEIGLLAIVTLPRSPEEAPTANLLGPLALNFAKRLGRQVIVQNSPYGTRWPLDIQRLGAPS